MKYFTLFFILLSSISSYAQKADTASHSKSTEMVYRVVQVMPEYPGGKDSLNAFIAANLKYPRSAKEDRVQGTVIVEFIVEADGTLSDIKVKKSVQAKLDQEAIRLVKLFPPYKPGKQGGKAVRVLSSVPIDFKITEKEGGK